jgi:ABC-type Fe3+ transport system substrate-binding protein
MCIQNFYHTNTGKMVPDTFYCFKEPNCSRDINKPEFKGKTITDPVEITSIIHATLVLEDS